MMDDLKNKVVLITGSSTGIGAAAALAFARAGAAVAVHANRSVAEGEQVLAQVRGHGARGCLVTGDVTDSASCRRVVEETVEQLGRIDVLINNAGGLVQRAPIEDITDKLFDEVLSLNVRSVMMCTAAAVVHMRRQGQGGSIINLTSVAARHGGGAGASLYAGAKGFVSTITKGLAKELVKDRIRVNAVAPGVITTPFHERYSTPQMLEGFRATIPMNRLGAADECAGAFLFLASETMSGYITGQTIDVNGGQYMP
jgi:3-oxoacyl-[acyl-carrier protein] reductase